jgi:UDP-2,3-diacylglucosamine pyrophosphatase LpxH
MLIFISDLHLMDEGFKEAIPTARLAQVIDGIIVRALQRGVAEPNIELVLLGDIFEVIKSQQWIDHDVRPWDPVTSKHRDVVLAIYRSILRANPAFEQWLTDLRTAYPSLRIAYVPGNHDLVINEEMGSLVRPVLRTLLGHAPTADRFPQEVRDPAHAVLARHGHEWDSSNRSGARGGPFGDVIVIEVLTRLPLRMAEVLGKKLDGDELNFLFELDNVRPQTKSGLIRWLKAGLDSLCRDRRDAAEAFDLVFNEILETLWAVGRTQRFEAFSYSSRAERTWAWGATKWAEFRGAHRLMGLFPIKEDAQGHYPDHVRGMLAAAPDAAVQYFLCGHTHIPEHVPLSFDGGRGQCVYMNTGTWRRVHLARNLDAGGSEGPQPHSPFASHQVECVATIYDRDEQALGLPPYEYYRTIHGLG